MSRVRRRRSAGPALADRARAFIPGRSLRIQVIAVAAAIVVAILSAQSFAAAREGATTYDVQPGDSLSRIALVTGVPIERLTSVNGLKDPDRIAAGQTLQLQPETPAATPGATRAVATPTPVSSGANYTVKEGDTLWDISLTANVSVAELIRLNSLADEDSLTVGQQLRVPVTVTAAARPTVKPSASAQPRLTLQQKVAAEAQRVGGQHARIGMAALNLGTGERVTMRSEESFPSASVMKLPILVELERQVAAGTLTWNGALRENAIAMMSVSDNEAANAITTLVKRQSVNDTMQRLGLGGTRYLNLFVDTRSPANPGQNQTTPANMARLLELIATDQLVNAQVSSDIRSLLARNTDRSKLQRLLPADTKLAHKSGWYDSVANDVGIVTVGTRARWVIAVFSQNVPDMETGNQVVAAISKVVYDQWATP